jgi:hypothetical protein
MFEYTCNNVLKFAEQSYHGCKSTNSIYDFKEDVNRTISIKRLLNRIIAGEDVEYLLVLNHLKTFFNVFPQDMALCLLFLRIEHDKWCLLKTFIAQIIDVPDFLSEIGLCLEDIPINARLTERLNELSHR